MKISTKKGDDGKSSLIFGKRKFKDEIIFETIGCLDELNAFIGLSRSKIKENSRINEKLKRVQKAIINISGYLASKQNTFLKKVNDLLKELELDIEEMEKNINLSSFIIFGDDEISALLNVNRVICRKCERRIISLIKNDKSYSKDIIKFINRLSDWLFLLSLRFVQKI